MFYEMLYVKMSKYYYKGKIVYKGKYYIDYVYLIIIKVNVF